VSPILRDRMQIIHCEGYSDKDKKSILKDYVWPQLLQRLRFAVEDVVLPDITMEHLIAEYSHDEKGVRNLIRASETIVTRLNMLRIANETVMKDYKFYIPVQFPVTLSIDQCKTLLFDMGTHEPESWRTMYN
jgi:ATP-dependent Lon protease